MASRWCPHSNSLRCAPWFNAFDTYQSNAARFLVNTMSPIIRNTQRLDSSRSRWRLAGLKSKWMDSASIEALHLLEPSGVQHPKCLHSPCWVKRKANTSRFPEPRSARSGMARWQSDQSEVFGPIFNKAYWRLRMKVRALPMNLSQPLVWTPYSFLLAKTFLNQDFTPTFIYCTNVSPAAASRT